MGLTLDELNQIKRELNYFLRYVAEHGINIGGQLQSLELIEREIKLKTTDMVTGKPIICK